VVEALQANNEIVAMTGDGVNDVLALKAADLAIAMGSGSAATRAIAQLVLVTGDFSTLPGVVHEGRRAIANVERVAKLFLTKTIYAALLAVATGIARFPFPFLPRQLTLVTALTIGIPGFFLAFAPEAPVSDTGFLRRIASFTIPAGAIAAIATFTAYASGLVNHEESVAEARTTATLVLGLVGIWIVDVLSRPLSARRELLIGLMVVLGVSSFLVGPLREFWKLDIPPLVVLVRSMVIAGLAIFVIEFGWRLGAKRVLNTAS
jgi:cation-transporting P-type ATPase E